MYVFQFHPAYLSSIFLAFIPILTLTGVLLYIWLWWAINDRLKPFYSLVNAVCIDGVLIIRKTRTSNPLTHVLGISSHHMLPNTFHFIAAISNILPPTCILWEIHRFASHPPNVMKFTCTVCVAIVKGHRSQQVSLVCVLFTAAPAQCLRKYLLNTIQTFMRAGWLSVPYL